MIHVEINNECFKNWNEISKTSQRVFLLLFRNSSDDNIFFLMENKQIFLVFSTFVDYEYQVPLLKKWINSKKKNNRELNSF